ncbi:MAG TPA: hypothetical protein VGM37_01285 [Armatimonadota bacterium]|jgi:hypothetical protein
MKYIGVLDYQNQPTQRRTEPNEDLRTVIGQLFNMAQSAAVECAKVTAAVWEESGQVGRSPLAKVLTISVDASKIPALLLRASDQAMLSLPGIGGTGRQKVPPRAACPYCDSVAELAEGGADSLVYRYHCCNPACGYDSSYNSSQLAAWLAKHPLREDGHKLTMPPGDTYTALASYNDGERFVLIVWNSKQYDTGIKSVTASGKEACYTFRCRPINGIKKARAVLKTWLADKVGVEYHDQAMHGVAAIPLWADPPIALTTVEELLQLLTGKCGWTPSSPKVLTTSGKKIEAYGFRMVRDDAISINGQTVALDDIARLEGTGSPEDFDTGYNAQAFTLYEKAGWTPPAPSAKGAGKGKKAKAGGIAVAEESATEPAVEIPAEDLGSHPEWECAACGCTEAAPCDEHRGEGEVRWRREEVCASCCSEEDAAILEAGEEGDA